MSVQDSPQYNILHPMSYRRSNTPSQKSDTLQRLEVETASTTSIPISFPYYYIEGNNNSFDTFNILNDKFNSNDPSEPIYNNTSHNIVKESPTNFSVGGLQLKTGPNPENQAQATEVPDDTFNPVPSRFSQFIPDHKQVDELSLNTTSLGSDSDKPPPLKVLTTSPLLKSKKSYSMSQRHTNPSYDLTREISHSMESQATIFLTREDQSHSKRPAYRASSSSSTLTRSKAIRSKEGGLIYRMKLRLKKFLKKIKQWKFKRTVSSKRTANNSMKRQRTRTKTLKRKFRAYPKNPAVKQKLSISAPVNNPGLGTNNAVRVSTLNDDLKFQAGASRKDVNLQQEGNDMKLNHLSLYIDLQQGLYLNSMDKKAGSIRYGKSPTASDIEEIPVSEYSSIPPPPPKHTVPHSETDLGNYDDLVDLWRQYLIFVVLKRIQLRQDIAYYQKMLVGQDRSTIYNIDEQEEVSDSETITTINSGNSKTTQLWSTISADKKVEAYIPDTTSEKFNRFKRQSVLSEMLDYESDTDLTSSETSLKYTNSMHSSIEKQYSIRPRTPIRSFSAVSSVPSSPIRRSMGYQMNLNEAR